MVCLLQLHPQGLHAPLDVLELLHPSRLCELMVPVQAPDLLTRLLKLRRHVGHLKGLRRLLAFSLQGSLPPDVLLRLSNLADLPLPGWNALGVGAHGRGRVLEWQQRSLNLPGDVGQAVAHLLVLLGRGGAAQSTPQRASRGRRVHTQSRGAHVGPHLLVLLVRGTVVDSTLPRASRGRGIQAHTRGAHVGPHLLALLRRGAAIHSTLQRASRGRRVHAHIGGAHVGPHLLVPLGRGTAIHATLQSGSRR
mmetsp:Transcript_90759/g.287573  ORF Transcript_90759/g.287573 Transcript_90759/m.287573 type:complete len:250 (-) Transcript_90759:1079-1828(-)